MAQTQQELDCDRTWVLLVDEPIERGPGREYLS